MFVWLEYRGLRVIECEIKCLIDGSVVIDGGFYWRRLF